MAKSPGEKKVIEIRPYEKGWQVVGSGTPPLSGPFFTGPSAVEHAIDHACERAKLRNGEIRLFARSGKIITTISFDNTEG